MNKLKMAVLSNKYLVCFINQQFNYILQKFDNNQPLTKNKYNTSREKVLTTDSKEKVPIDYSTTMFVHFTYCSNMRSLPKKGPCRIR